MEHIRILYDYIESVPDEAIDISDKVYDHMDYLRRKFPDSANVQFEQDAVLETLFLFRRLMKDKEFFVIDKEWEWEITEEEISELHQESLNILEDVRLKYMKQMCRGGSAILIQRILEMDSTIFDPELVRFIMSFCGQ